MAKKGSNKQQLVRKGRSGPCNVTLKDTKKDAGKAMELTRTKSSFPVVFEILRLPPIDNNDVEQVSKRLSEYLEICERNNIAPTRETLGLAFKVDRHSIYAWTSGKIKSKPPEIVEMVKLVCAAIDASLVQDGLENQGNPAFRIFLMRNNHAGYTNDDDRLDMKPIDFDAPERSVEEISRKYHELAED